MHNVQLMRLMKEKTKNKNKKCLIDETSSLAKTFWKVFGYVRAYMQNILWEPAILLNSGRRHVSESIENI